MLLLLWHCKCVPRFSLFFLFFFSFFSFFRDPALSNTRNDYLACGTFRRAR